MESEDPKKYLLEEYKDVSSNMRQYGNIRFAQLTLFSAINAGLLTFLEKHEMGRLKIVCLAGLVVSVLFWFMEKRATEYWIWFRERAQELEDKLEFQQYTKRPPAKLMSASYAVQLLFLAVFVFWAGALLWCRW